MTEIEAGWAGVDKDAVLRPSSIEKEASASVPKLVKDNKRKRAFVPENQKPKKRTAHKPSKNTIPLTVESVMHLRNEDDEEEENDGSALAARTKKTTNVPQEAGSMVFHKAPPRTEDISEKDSGRVPELLEIKDASHRISSSRRQCSNVEDVTGTSDASDLFYGVQRALNQAVAAHRETCSRSRAELRRYEADLQQVTEEKNSLKLLLGQREEEIKDLRVELAKAHQDQTDLSEQLQQKIEIIGKICEEVDAIKAEFLKWKEGMDRFAAEKEDARTQLSAAENQLQNFIHAL
ncbi:uncharacterized protein [Nicotiana tomentosiformis]|uniref:uncharacterized protein n=1 Tax=Nicotiana tomentosiformis TaxID=4098 RepID=UPI00388C4B3D